MRHNPEDLDSISGRVLVFGAKIQKLFFNAFEKNSRVDIFSTFRSEGRSTSDRRLFLVGDDVGLSRDRHSFGGQRERNNCESSLSRSLSLSRRVSSLISTTHTSLFLDL